MIMMPSCPYFILSTPLSLNMWTWLSILVFAWEQARSKLGGVDTSILHHAFMLIFIALWTVISHYGTILMPFLSYFTRFTWRGRMPVAGILDWKRSKSERPILHNSKSPETSRRIIFVLFTWIKPSMVIHPMWMVYWISIVVIHIFIILMPKDAKLIMVSATDL